MVLLRSLWANFVLVFLTVVLGPPIILISPLRRGELSMALGRFGARLHCRAAGVRLVAEGLDRIPPGRPCVFVANHQGTFDAHAMMLTVPTPVRVLVKKELFAVPIFGWGLTILGFPKVDRQNSPRAREQMERATASVRRRAIHLFGFPEGTRHQGEGLLPFKKGLLVMAIELGYPVVPVVIQGSRRVQGRKTLIIHPGTIRLRLLDPVFTEGLTYGERDRLIGEVRERILEALDPSDR